MRSYEERAKDFIKQIFPYILGVWRPTDVRNMVAQFNQDFNRKVLVGNGLSRVALITSDYVVKWDYDEEEVACIGGCENEVSLYAKAEHDGFAYLFAKITRYQYNDRTFYIMPRVHGIRDRWDYAEDYMTVAEREWCDEHELTDLHCNNYGFRNGHVCIIDYACRSCGYSISSGS